MAGMRIGGLASGMDIDQIVSDLMRAERIPFDKTKQKKQTLEWRRDAFREMNTLMSKLRDETLNMRLQSTFLSKKTTSSNEDKLTASASSRAGDVSYQITNATLATAAYNSSKLGANEKISNTPSGKLDQTKKLSDLQSEFSYSSSIKWDNVVKDAVHVFEEGTSLKLSRGNIKDESLYSAEGADKITVTTKDGPPADVYDVVYEMPEKLTSTQVYVNKDTGQMTFGEKLAKDSTIQVNYSSYKNDLLSVSTASKDFQLTTPGLIMDGDKVHVKDEQVIVKTTKTVDGKTVTEDHKYSQVSSKTALIAGSNTFYVDEDGKMTFSDTIEKGSTISLSYTHKVVNTGITTYNEDGNKMTQSFSFDGSEKLNDMFYKINTSNIGVNVYYDEYADKLSISRKETGDFNASGSEINFIAEDEFFTGAFKINTDPSVEKGGTNAKFTINGLETWRHSNTFTINDFTFTLKDEIGATPVTITSKNNTDTVFDNVKKFVDLYNETIAKTSTKIKEERNRDYLPLTEDQKESLSEKEIEKWENLAKSGVIRNDPILTSVLNQMRIDFYSAVNNNTGEYKQLSSIGITTSNNYLEGGKLVINEDKLRKAVEDDPEAIYKLFAADGESYGEKGISRRLRDTLTSAIEKVTNTAGNEIKTNSQFTIGKELDDIEDRISNFDRILSQKEDRYWKMYTAMEKAIQKSNEQSAYLTQQLGAWTGGQ